MTPNDASRITRVIDQRIEKAVSSSAFVEHTLATVNAVAAGRTLSALLYDESDPAYASEGFRIPGPYVPAAGDRVIVAMDKARGDRWVREVILSGDYHKVYFGTDGKVYFGDGTAAGDVTLYRKADGKLYYTDSADVEHEVGAGGGGVADGDKGDVTVSSGGTVWTVDSGAITYAKLQNVSATDKLLGRASAGAGVVEEIALTAAGRALIDDADAAAQRATLGLGSFALLSSLAHSSLTGVGADDHHAKSHVHSGDGSGTVAHSSLSGIGNDDHGYFVRGTSANRTNSFPGGSPNNGTESGFFEAAPGAVGNPDGSNWFWYINQRHSNTGNYYGFQIAQQIGSDITYIRNLNNGGWGTWKRLWNAGDFWPGTQRWIQTGSTSVSLGSSGAADCTITFGGSFGDTAYQLICTFELNDATNRNPPTYYVKVGSKGAASAVIRVLNNAAVALTYTVRWMAIHD